MFFLETMLDQIQFMIGLLGLPALRTRVERYFQSQRPSPRRIPGENSRVLLPATFPRPARRTSWKLERIEANAALSTALALKCLKINGWKGG
jgi:hypothetical protein